MSDIRKRVGRKGTTYQVRYPNRASKTGYAYKTFDTLKEARAFVESGKTQADDQVLDRSITTVHQAVDKWLRICEKEGTDGNEPVTTHTLKLYKYYAEFMRAYQWEKTLPELQAPDIVKFRSWLLTNLPSRYLARRTLTYFQTVLNEMALRGHVGSDLPWNFHPAESRASTEVTPSGAVSAMGPGSEPRRGGETGPIALSLAAWAAGVWYPRAECGLVVL